MQTINLGNIVNDGLGDDLRTAFQKVNSNFTQLATELSVDGTNIGSVGAGIFKERSDNVFKFKRLIAGDSTVVVTDGVDAVQITSPLQNSFTSLITPQGTVSANTPTSSVNFINGNNVRITRSGSDITFSADVVSSSLTSNLNINNNNIVGLGNINITGTVTATNVNSLVYNKDIRPIDSAVFDFDFGTINQGTFSSVTSFLLAAGDYDFGSITEPSTINLDFGTI